MNKRVKIESPAAATEPKHKTKAPSQAYAVIEPRIMLDANIGWTIDASDSLTEALEGVTSLLDADFAAFDTFVDSFETTLNDIAPALDAVLGEDDSALDFLSKTVAALRASAEALKAGADDILDGLVTNGFHSGLVTGLHAWVDATSTGTAAEKTTLKTLISLADLQDAFDKEAFRTGAIDANVGSYVSSLSGALAQNGLSLVAAETRLTNLIETGLGGNSDATLEFTLANATVGGRAIAFADGTNPDEVDVTIDLPGLNLDLNALFGAALQNAALPLDLSASGLDASLTFTLKATTAVGAIGIDAVDFALDDLLSFGGDLTLGGTDLTLGLLQLSVDEAETAAFALGVATEAAMTLSTSVNLSTLAITATATDADLTGSLMINEAGGPDTFVQVAADTEYALLALGLSGTTAFVTGLNDANAADDDKAFLAALTVTGVVKSSTATTANSRISAFLASAGVGFDIDLSGSVSDVSKRAGMELALENLAVLGSEEILQFLSDVGSATQAILTDAAMDVTVPFTNIDLNLAAQAIAEIFASLPQSFLIDPTQLGFATGAPGALFEVDASFVQSGAVMTAEQIAKLRTIGTAEFRIATKLVGATAETYTALSIDMTNNAILQDAGASADAVVTEFVRLVNAAIKIYGMAASVVSNTLTFSSRYPGNDPANTPPTLSLVGIRERGQTTDNDAFSLADLGFAGTDVATDADGLSTGAGDTLGAGSETKIRFDQRAGIEAIVGPTFAQITDGATAFKLVVTLAGTATTVTVNAPGTGWLLADGTPDVAALLTSLNAALDTASVAVTATANFDGTGFRLLPDTAGQSLSIAPEPLAPLQSTISAALNAHAAEVLDSAEVADLKTLANLELRVVTGNVDSEGKAEVVAVTVNLTEDPADDILTSPTSTDSEILDAVAQAIDDALSAYDIDVEIDNGAFRITSAFPGGNSANPPLTFGIIGADLRSGGTFDDSVSLETLGFGTGALELPVDYGLSTDAGDGGDGEEFVLKFFGTSSQTLFFGPRFAEEMIGVSELLFTVTVGGEDHQILIERPAGDWVGAGNVPRYAEIATAFNAAFTDAGFALSVTVLAGDAGLSFGVPSGTTEAYGFGIEPGKLVRALSIDGLFDWVNVELNKIEVLEGSKLMLSDEGELLFQFPDITRSATISSSSQLSGLQVDQLGLGQLENVELSANLQATVTGSLNMVAGLDLVGLGAGLFDDTREDIAEIVFENVFLQDVEFVVDLTGKATNVTGKADLGLLAIDIGATAPNLNFLALNAQLDVGIVGEDTAGNKTTQVSLVNIRDAFNQGRVTDLIGRYDLQGGILTEDGANAYDTSGDRATIDTLQILDPNDAVLGAGEELVMLYATLGDIRIDAGGMTGLNEGLIDGINIAIGDGLDPLNTFAVAVYSNDAEAQEAIDGLSNLEDGDILDTLSAIGHTLQVVGEKLKSDLPFLDQDIPLLNFSLLDGVDFATEFVDTLREVRDNPQATLDKIEEFLEGIFGADTIELVWVSAEQTITIEMEFGFLKDYQETLPFSLDLDELLAGNFGSDIDPEVAKLISGIADISGDGTLVFDPDLTLRFKFGIDLRPTLNPSTVIAASDLALQQLENGSVVSMNASGPNDIQIVWTDLRVPDVPVEKSFGVDLDGLTTLGEIVEAINAALVDGIGAPASDTVSFTYDEATGTITFVDTEGVKIDTTGVEALFGAVEAASSGDPREIAFDAGFADFAGAQSFDLVLGSDGEGWPVTVELAADATRDTVEDFAAAVNAALVTLGVSRDVLSDVAGPILEVRVSQLVKAEVVAGALRLVETNFAEALGYESRDFAVRGVDASEPVFLQIQSLGESNIASVLGFGDVEGASFKGKIVSEVLYEYTEVAAPRVYLDTDRSAVTAELKAGIENSLNITIGIGPLEVNVVDGSALLTAGKDTTDPARFGFTFLDVDGDAFENQYDLRDLFDLVNDPDRSILDMIQMDVAVGVLIDLPLSDSLGIFNPATDGLTYSADLLLSIDGQSLATFDLDQIETHFEGDLIALYNGEAVDPDNLDLRLPDLTELFANFNYLAFLNDPRAVLSALDTILNQMQSLFDNYLSKIELPVIGDKIGSGVTFFDDFRYKVLEQIRIKAETPDPETGKLPTTVDLLTNEVNALMNDLFNTNDVVYMQARLDTSGSTSESYLIASLNFNGIIFDEDLAIDFEFGIPGLDLEVSDGSKLHLTLDYLVNIGFGIDKNGFFLLNDTDEKEIGITFTVDAGSFEGSAEVLGVLGLTAKAVTLGDDGEIELDANGDVVSDGDGVAYVSATLGADLFSDQGLDIIDSGDAGDGEIVRDFGDIDLRDALGNELNFEKLIYFNEIDYGNLISFGFGASFELQVSLSGSVLDPTTGEPIRIGGVAILPTVATEFWVKGSYEFGDGLTIEKLSFENVRLDMQELYEAVLKPILDPIMEVVNPLADYFRWTQETPFKEALSVAGAAFPIIGIANTAITIGLQVTDMVNSFVDTGGMLIFGDFDFTPNAEGIVSGEKTVAQSSSSVSLKKNASYSGAPGTAANPFGVFGNLQSGIAIEIPLLSDPTNILDLIMGKYDQVDLVEVHMNLFNFDTGKIDIVDEILSGIGLPGWAKSAIKSAFQAEMSLKFKAGFSAGYDLGGIVNFVNTLDAVRLLDGVYIDAAPGALVNAEVWGRFELNAFIAGVSGEVGAGVKISFNDPNSDGKLRIPEMIALVEAAADALAAGDVGEALGLIFVGEAYYKAKLSVWAGINLPWPLPDLKWSTTVFDIGDTIHFGGNPVPARMVTDLDAGETAFLNIGARSGDSMTKIIGDGNDRLVLTGGGGSNYTGVYSQGSQSFSGSFGNNGSALVMQAGEGNNVLDLSGASGALPTVSYTGAGTDTIILPTSGLHVVFAGAGNDTIRTNSASTGTYIIFGEEGSDTIDIKGGNVIYFGDDSFGARDLFQATFAAGGVTEASIRSFFGIDANGVPQAGASQMNFSVNGVATNLHGLFSSFTIDTQLSANKDADTVTLGSGNHVVLTGAGADQIKVNGAAGVGTMTILSGDGSDLVEITNGGTVLVEAGAGGDRVYVNASSSTIWGYGAASGTDGLIGTEAGTAIDALAIRDSMDILIGGAGADRIIGQLGSDYIEGGDGNDTLVGGIGDDIIVGGKMILTDKDGAAIILRNLIPNSPLQNGLSISIEDRADGNDDITGSSGLDILLGGGGNDTLRGNAGSDVLLGDFGKVGLSSNLVAQEVFTEFDLSSANGTDVLEGGLGGDILIAGGGIAGQTESITDLEGSNVALGDFGLASGARMLDAVSLVESFASTNGSSDRITTGRGNDIQVGGEGNDTLNAGSGGDIVIGDLGRVNPGNAVIESMASTDSGDDSVTTDAADNVFDIVIGGGGSDTVVGGLGGMVLLGDDGKLTLDGVALSLLLAYEAPSDTATQEDLDADLATRERIAGIARLVEGQVHSSAGDDDVTIAGGILVALLGGGNDAASNSDAADVVYVLGDNGTITIETAGTTLESAVDDSDGNDTITLGSGNDWIIAGGGDDNVDGGDGENVVLGDHGSYNGSLLKSDPTARDGGDTIAAGSGNDLIFAGGGADSIAAGGGNNVILGDFGTYDGTDLVSELTVGDASDTIVSGGGNDWIIAGGDGDSIASGTGNDVILGDTGSFDGVDLISERTLGDASDTIGSGGGNDWIIAGGDADSIDAGDGDDYILGDSGSIDAETLTSALNAGDGNDSVTGGSGNDWVILGQGDDLADLGTGNNRALGDSGVIVNAAAVTLDTTSILMGGNDTIQSTGGNDILIGGAGSDQLSAGNGDNTALGDNGNVTYDPAVTQGVTSATTVVSAAGAADTIETGDGRDVILAGEGGDRVLAGAGADLVMGDQGVVTGSAPAAFGTLTSLVNEVPGDDHIDLGAGNDVAIGGLGNDSIFAGQGEDMALGDSGHIKFSGLSAIEEIVLEDQDRGGDDFITAAGVGGDNILVGQFGADTIEGGTDDDIILGDFALFNFLPGAQGFAGQSSADRMQKMTSVRVDLSFNDLLTGDLGSDFMLGGMGDDVMYGDEGQDFMIGDMIIFERTWEARGLVIFEETTVDTNFAYITGGYDEFFSGDGPDVMIGGLGPDIFYGNTETDLIYSDAYAGLFYATWTEGHFGTTPQRFLIKSNFAGPGAIDVVSESQQDSSIGSPLDLRHLGYNADLETGDFNSMDRLSALLASGGVPHMTDLVIDILGGYDVIKAISALVAGGIDLDVLVDALMNEVMQALLSLDTQNLINAEIMIERIIRMYLAHAGILPATDAEKDEANGSDGAERLWKIAAE